MAKKDCSGQHKPQAATNVHMPTFTPNTITNHERHPAVITGETVAVRVVNDSDRIVI